MSKHQFQNMFWLLSYKLIATNCCEMFLANYLFPKQKRKPFLNPLICKNSFIFLCLLKITSTVMAQNLNVVPDTSKIV